MTIVEILKKMGSDSKRRICRSIWLREAWIEIDHGIKQKWLRRQQGGWIPGYEDLLADDWIFWEMPDETD